jgi:hypothetical protein
LTSFANFRISLAPHKSKLLAWPFFSHTSQNMHMLPVQVKLDALPPTASYHRGASTDEEADSIDAKKPQTAH